MADDNGLFIWLLSFWVLITIVSNVFHEDIMLGNIRQLRAQGIEETEIHKTFISQILDIADNIPIINIFTPLLRIMSFEYVTINPILIIILDMISILSAYTMVLLFKK